MSDQIKKFLLEDRSVRVSAVELQDVWQAALLRQTHAPAIEHLLGELMGAAALLTSSIKFDGSLLLQLQGQGSVRLIVVECRADMSMRATVRAGSEPLADEEGLRDIINPDGQGRFSVIINPPKTEAGRLQQPYQGIVSADTENVAQAIEQYMTQSEQLDTRLWLHVSSECVRGLMLQRMPVSGGIDSTTAEQALETWEHALALCSTLTPQEMAETDIETLLQRLFWERPVISLETKDAHWHCGCTRERVQTMLKSLGRTEVDDILDKESIVEITCEFCAERYTFDAQQVADLFASDTPISGTLH